MGRLTALGAALLLGIGFQNCTWRSDSTEVSSKPKFVFYGNGEGYGGKVNYINTSASCPGGDINSRLQVDFATKKATVIQENCAPVAPYEIDFTQLNLLPHNQENLTHQERVYDIESGLSGFSSVLCRGSENQFSTGNNQLADAIIRNAGDGSLTGRVVLGIYDSMGSLLDVKDSSTVAVIPLAMADRTLYNSSPSSGQMFTLDVYTENGQLKARLTYDLNFSSPPVGSGPVLPMPPGAPDPTQFHVVTHMSCWRQ